MTEHNMQHVNYLSDIANADVAHIRKKEGTYQGSWKKRGGVGAFMMMARKWDRLESILSRDKAHPYDVFAAIEFNPDGGDGTVLAEVRDLRHYLLLVESEMVARGVIDLDNAHHLPQHEFDFLSSGRDQVGARTGRFPSSHIEEISKPRTPEDGGHHATLTPWIVDTEWCLSNRFTQDDYGVGLSTRLSIFHVWWRQLSPVTWALEPFVQGDIPPTTEVLSLYQYSKEANGYIIDIALCPLDARDRFPNLPMEQNRVELLGQMPWCQTLYDWDPGEEKYKLTLPEWHYEERL